MEDENEKLMSEKEAADWFGWSVDKMRKIRKSGVIQYYEFNKQVIKYSLQQLEDYKQRFLKQAA